MLVRELARPFRGDDDVAGTDLFGDYDYASAVGATDTASSTKLVAGD